MTKAVKYFTLDEIAEHSTKDAPWLLIHGNVYNVTQFLDEHPGGEEVLLEQAGGHATEAFEDIGHSTDAKNLMSKYLIGELCEEDKKKIAEIPPRIQVSSSGFDESSWKSWMIPVFVAILVSLMYRFYLGLNA